MSHHHGHHHHHHTVAKGLSLAFWLNLVFAIIEVIGGVWTNSTAIIADAFHDFMDAVAIGIAVLLEKISGRKRTSKYSYGYRRFSLLAALGMSVLLITGAVWMTVSAVRSFVDPQEVHSVGMLWLAVLGIAVNSFAFLRIRWANKQDEGHGQHHNSRAVMLHLLEDVLGWVAVLIGAVVIYLTGWYWIDGVLALAIAAFIGYNAVRNLVSTMKVLLQSVPDHLDMEELTTNLLNISGVESIHDLHVWSMDGHYHISTLHAVVGTSDTDRKEAIYEDIVQLLKTYHIQHPTVQIETEERNCRLKNC